jgi:hypothetical protein
LDDQGFLKQNSTFCFMGCIVFTPVYVRPFTFQHDDGSGEMDEGWGVLEQGQIRD